MLSTATTLMAPSWLMTCLGCSSPSVGGDDVHGILVELEQGIRELRAQHDLRDLQMKAMYRDLQQDILEVRQDMRHSQRHAKAAASATTNRSPPRSSLSVTTSEQDQTRVQTPQSSNTSLRRAIVGPKLSNSRALVLLGDLERPTSQSNMSP